MRKSLYTIHYIHTIHCCIHCVNDLITCDRTSSVVGMVLFCTSFLWSPSIFDDTASDVILKNIAKVMYFNHVILHIRVHLYWLVPASSSCSHFFPWSETMTWEAVTPGVHMVFVIVNWGRIGCPIHFIFCYLINKHVHLSWKLPFNAESCPLMQQIINICFSNIFYIMTNISRIMLLNFNFKS